MNKVLPNLLGFIVFALLFHDSVVWGLAYVEMGLAWSVGEGFMTKITCLLVLGMLFNYWNGKISRYYFAVMMCFITVLLLSSIMYIETWIETGSHYYALLSGGRLGWLGSVILEPVIELTGLNIPKNEILKGFSIVSIIVLIVLFAGYNIINERKH